MKSSVKKNRAGYVFLGLSDICGYYSQLEHGLIKLGIPCVLVNAFPSIAYERNTRPPWPGRVVEAVARMRIAANRGTMRRYFYTVIQAFCMGYLFIWSLSNCGVYVFAGGISFLPPYDLWLLKRLGKRIIIVFHGSDARPPYVNGATVCETTEEVAQCIAEAARMKKRLRTIEKYADIIVNHVLSSHFHERPIVGWLNIGIPCDISRFTFSPKVNQDSCVIVHAPTRPGPKGTAYIEAAIENLRRKGHQITFIKLTGRTNKEILDAISTCDFVVDELFSDTTMASFAAEAAAFGKPAIVGLYGYEELKRWTEPALLPPAMVCDASEIQRAIEALIVDKDLRLSIGAQARRFIEQQWHSSLVAERFRRLCEGTVPESWYFDPSKVRYLHGWGVSDKQTRARVAAVLNMGGPSALQLQDKPVLEQDFIKFAGSFG